MTAAENQGGTEMTGSSILDVAIGLILMYLIVSLFCSVIQEWIARLFSWRAANLHDAILHMLGGTKGEPTDAAKAVLEHPLVKLLPASAPQGEKPSYISANNFALALFYHLVPNPKRLTRNGSAITA